MRTAPESQERRNVTGTAGTVEEEAVAMVVTVAAVTVSRKKGDRLILREARNLR